MLAVDDISAAITHGLELSRALPLLRLSHVTQLQTTE